MDHTKTGRARAAAVLCAGVLALALSALPALTLWLGERQALAQPHARTRQAGVLSLTGDDVYLTRVLKQYAVRETPSVSESYSGASLYLYDMEQTDSGVVTAYLSELCDAGVLPQAWYNGIVSGMDSTAFTDADSLGLRHYIVCTAPEFGAGFYQIGVTVETQSQRVVGLWGCVGQDGAPPAPDAQSALGAFVRYLELEGANDWAPPAPLPYEQKCLYSANLDLLLYADSGSYLANKDYYFSEKAGWDDEQRECAFFCLNAMSLSADIMQKMQAFSNSFYGVPDVSFPVGELRSLTRSSGTADALYEAAVCTAETNAATGETVRQKLVVRTDYASLTQRPLCSVPGCAHTDSSCPAFIGAANDVFAIGDRVFALRSASSISYSGASRFGASLDVIDAAGTKRERLVDFPVGWEIYADSLYATDGDALYGRYFDANTNAYQGLRVDLSTGACDSFLLSDYPSNYYTDSCGGVGTTLVTLQTQYPDGAALVFCPEVARNESYAAYTNEEPSTFLTLYDLSTGLRKQVSLPFPPDAYSRYAFSPAMQNGWIYYQLENGESGMTNVVRFHPLTGELQTVLNAEDSSRYSIYYPAGYLPALAPDAHDYLIAFRTEQPTECALIDIQTGELLPVGLHYSSPYDVPLSSTPVACTGDGRFLVPTASLDSAWEERLQYALADRDTLISGSAASLQPVQMWTPEAPLG